MEGGQRSGKAGAVVRDGFAFGFPAFAAVLAILRLMASRLMFELL